MDDQYDTEDVQRWPNAVTPRPDAQSTPTLVPERTPGDRFENAIRVFGVVAACEWFGHSPDSEFTKETIRVLDGRATGARAEGATR